MWYQWVKENIHLLNLHIALSARTEKVLEFKRALKNGDCGLGFEKLNKHQFGKIIELGFYDREIKSL